MAEDAHLLKIVFGFTEAEGAGGVAGCIVLYVVSLSLGVIFHTVCVSACFHSGLCKKVYPHIPRLYTFDWLRNRYLPGGEGRGGGSKILQQQE